MDSNATKSSSQANTLKRIMIGELVVGLVLSIPFLSNAPWTGSDYVFAGIILSLCATVYVFATKNSNNVQRKVAVGVGILFFIFLVIGWAASGP